MSELADFVLDFCRALGGVVEPPAYGVYEVLLPDTVAAQLGIETFQRWTFDDARATNIRAEDGDATRLSYGHPLVEQLAELARAAPACARFYINTVRLEKSGLLELARAGLAFPNATLVEVPHVMETRVLFHYARFNFKAALLSDEKRERLVSALMDVQTGAPAPDFSADEALRLEAAPAFTALPDAPVLWMNASAPLAPETLRALLDRAARAAGDALGKHLAALEQRAARLLELDRARLDAYYADLERDLERRLKRAEDETRRKTLEDKLAVTRADHAAKLADAEAKYRVRAELDLVNLALITQPKMTLTARIENRQAGVTRAIVWDPLRRRIEPLVCDVCQQPSGKLFLCANNHLAGEQCLAPQCVDCKRVYCRTCAHEVTTCVVCGRPVCQRTLTRCRECGQGTCREHANQCHAPREAVLPAEVVSPSAAPPPAAVKAKSPPASKPRKPAPVRARRPATAAQPLPADYHLDVEVRTNEALVVAFVLTKGKGEIAQRQWQLTELGIRVACLCEKGWQCPSGFRMLEPDSPARIEAQIEAEIDRLRAEYRIPPYRAAIYTEERGEYIRLPRLRLRGRWKDPAALHPAPLTQLAESPEDKAAETPIEHPGWALAFSPVEAEGYLPEIDRFVRLAYGWLIYEGALQADELAALTASAAKPGAWYAPERARDIFKADPRFRILRGKIVSITPVKHPLKVMQAKAARALPPLALTAEELLAAAEGLPLTAREMEIEQALNRRAAQKIDLRSLQALMRNADNPAEILPFLLELCAPRDEPEARTLTDQLSELWNHTHRYELRGRTPSDLHAT